MANEDLKKRLITLAARAKGSNPTILEQVRLELRIDAKTRVSKTEVRQVISEALEIPESDVRVKLASHEDSERILDDIVNILNGPGR
jgi:hypothetical protein